MYADALNGDYTIISDLTNQMRDPKAAGAGLLPVYAREVTNFNPNPAPNSNKRERERVRCEWELIVEP